MTQTVITNGRPRDVLAWEDLTAKERADFDYLDSEERQDSAHFARYRGAAYDLGEFMPAPAELKPWQGCAADSYFSATLFRYVDGADFESVIMGRVYS